MQPCSCLFCTVKFAPCQGVPPATESIKKNSFQKNNLSRQIWLFTLISDSKLNSTALNLIRRTFKNLQRGWQSLFEPEYCRFIDSLSEISEVFKVLVVFLEVTVVSFASRPGAFPGQLLPRMPMNGECVYGSHEPPMVAQW